MAWPSRPSFALKMRSGDTREPRLGDLQNKANVTFGNIHRVKDWRIFANSYFAPALAFASSLIDQKCSEQTHGVWSAKVLSVFASAGVKISSFDPLRPRQGHR